MHIIIQTVVLVLTGLLTLCLVLCIGCEWIDTHPFEPFNVDSSETETEDTTYTPELTYFTISVDNPNDNVMSSSEYLQQKKREQQRQLEKRRKKNATTTESQKKNDEDEEDKPTSTAQDVPAATKQINGKDDQKEHSYWFFNGRHYVKKTIAETKHILTIWNNNCPDMCKLWIQIGSNTTPIQIAEQNVSTIHKHVENGLKEKVEGIQGCYTPATETPDTNFTCMPCEQRQLPDPGYASNSNRTTDVRQTENMWYYLPEYIAKTSTNDLVKRIYSTRGKCSTTCQLLFHGGLNTPLEVNSKNEESIKSVVQQVKDRGTTKGFILCCALKSVSIDRMYNSKTNTFNCQRCSKYIHSDSGANDGGEDLPEDNTNGYDPSEYSPYEVVDFEPAMIEPTGKHWTSADKKVWPYSTTMDSETMCKAPLLPTPMQKQLYGKDKVETETNEQVNHELSNVSPPPSTIVHHIHHHTIKKN